MWQKNDGWSDTIIALVTRLVHVFFLSFKVTATWAGCRAFPLFGQECTMNDEESPNA
jgi:hypothetical protein